MDLRVVVLTQLRSSRCGYFRSGPVDGGSFCCSGTVLFKYTSLYFLKSLGFGHVVSHRFHHIYVQYLFSLSQFHLFILTFIFSIFGVMCKKSWPSQCDGDFSNYILPGI